MRKLARSVARANMDRKGLTRYCKRSNETASPAEMKRGSLPEHKRSFFAEHWRDYVR